MEIVVYTIEDIPADLAAEAVLKLQVAPDLRCLVNNLDKSLDKLWKVSRERQQGGDWINQHPIVGLYLRELCELNHGRCIDLETMTYDEDWSIPEGMAEDALMVQSACNGSAVIRSLRRVVDRLWDASEKLAHRQQWVNQHPIVAMYLNQLWHLHHRRCIEHPRMNHFWELCEKAKAREEVKIN